MKCRAKQGPIQVVSLACAFCTCLLPAVLGRAVDGVRAEPDLDHWVWRTPVPPGSALSSVAYRAGRLVAVGGDGRILVSPDGVSWQAVDSGVGGYLSAVTGQGPRLVAVGSRGTILTSPNGLIWTPAASPTDAWLRAVAWCPDQSVYVAVGDEGSLLTSSNGLAWTPCTSGVPPWLRLRGAAASPGRVVAVGEDGVVVTSPDGVNWVPQGSPTAADLHAVTWSGAEFLAVGEGGAVLASADGLVWVPQDSGSEETLYGVVFDAPLFCVLGDRGTILTSTPGLGWSPQSSGAVTPLRGVTATAAGFCGVGDFGMILTSEDGLVWEQQTSWTGVLSAVTWSGDLYCVVGDGGTVLTSLDGTVWSRQASGTAEWLTDVAFSGSRFVAVGSHGTALLSPDGALWLPGAAATDAFLSAVVWSGTAFVAVGEAGTILTSADGGVWTSVASGSSQWLTDIAWSGDLFAAVGSNGTVLTSPDGSAWSSRVSGTGAHLSTVAWAGTQFVAAGSWGTVLTSADGETWVEQSSGVAANLTASSGSGTVILVAGEAGTLLSSEDGVTWTPRASGTSQWLHGLNWSGTQYTGVGSRGTIIACTPSPVAASSPTWLALNLGDAYTRVPTVVLHNTCSGRPVEYAAAESPEGFEDAVWMPYQEAPLFTFSPGDGERTVYFRVRDAEGESIWISDTITLDTTPPSVILTTEVPPIVNHDPFPVTITFSEPVLGFALEDVLVEGGTVHDLVEVTPSQVWEVSVDASEDGVITLRIDSGIAVDLAGNANLAAAPLVRLFDGTAPSVATLQPADNAVGLPREGELVVVFDEPIEAGEGTVTLVATASGTVIATIDVNPQVGQVMVQGNTVTIPHPPLAAGWAYHVLIEATCFVDAAGNAFAGFTAPSSWNFTVLGWSVAFSAGPNGTLTGAVSQMVPEGGAATAVTAVPNTGYGFLRWLLAGEEYSTANPLTVGPVMSDMVFTAEFALNTYPVTFAPGANGSLTGVLVQSVAHGGAATPVTAVPATGYHFVRWLAGGTPYGSANPLTVTGVVGPMVLTAEFAINTYTVTFSPGANGTLTGTLTQTVTHGASTTAVTAVPDYTYAFSHWSDGSGANPRTVSPAVSNLDLTAVFRPANAVDPEGSFLALVRAADVLAGRGLWDISGSYSIELGAGDLTLDLLQDGRGKVTGTGTYSYSSASVDLAVRGNLRGKAGDIAVTLEAKGIEPAGADGRPIKTVIHMRFALDEEKRQLVGTAQLIRNNEVPTPKTTTSLNLVLPLPAGMDGTYEILSDLRFAGTRVAGEAVLKLSNDAEFLLAVKGKRGGDVSDLTFIADRTDVQAKGIRLACRVETLELEWARLVTMSGKALGQSLRY
ncbi:MAG: Ig-like domain-containing protein [Lentisphaeria bacterium]|nr:Ig-like domain-containing protein [Lentisphaeria bacterium]